MACQIVKQASCNIQVQRTFHRGFDGQPRGVHVASCTLSLPQVLTRSCCIGVFPSENDSCVELTDVHATLISSSSAAKAFLLSYLNAAISYQCQQRRRTIAVSAFVCATRCRRSEDGGGGGGQGVRQPTGPQFAFVKETENGRTKDIRRDLRVAGCLSGNIPG